MNNVTYKHKLTGEMVQIVESNDVFYKLSNGQQVLQSLFITNYIPEMPIMDNIKQMDSKIKESVNSLNINSSKSVDSLDPESFFNYTNPNFNSFVDKLSKIENVADNAPNTTVVKSSDGVLLREPSLEERIEEARRNNAKLIQKFSKNTNQNTISEEEKIRQDKILLTGVDPTEEELDKLHNNIQSNPIQQPKRNNKNSFLDGFMSSFKNNYSVSISLELSEKIVEPNFIKMISNNINDDIIEWYSNQFIDKLLEDRESLKKDIYNKLYSEVYGKSKKISKSKPKIQKEKPIKKDKIESEKIEEHILIEGQPTKNGKKTFKYKNEKGEIKDYLPETANKKGYIPAKKEDLKNE